MKHLVVSFLQIIWAGALGGAISGAICSGLFGGIVFLAASIGPQESFSVGYIPLLLWWGTEEAVLGSLLGLFIGLLIGPTIVAVRLTSYAHYIGATVGAVIMGLFCSFAGLPAIIFGVVSGTLAGYLGGKQISRSFVENELKYLLSLVRSLA